MGREMGLAVKLLVTCSNIVKNSILHSWLARDEMLAFAASYFKI